MRQRFDHPAGGFVRQLRVAIERNDKPDAGEAIRIAHVNQTPGIAGARPRDQFVEFLKFPPFSLPANEFLLGFAPCPLAMQQEEALFAVAPVQGFDAFDGCLQQARIRLVRVLRRILVIRIQAKKQVGFFIGEVADLQLLRFGLNCRPVDQHHRHGDECPAGVGDSRNPEIHLRQNTRREQPRHQIIHDLQGQLACGREH